MKAKSMHEHGREMAKKRYGGSEGKLDEHPKANNLQPPQDVQDEHCAGYDNDASGWVRGAGEKAEAKPGFDHHKAGR